jgi:hypothetical protein
MRLIRHLSLVSILLAFSVPDTFAFPRLVQAGAVQSMFSQCGCLCVEGVPKTLCSTVEEAQQNPAVCGLRHCPDYVATEADGQRYVSPHAFADNCRDVRVWNGAAGAYTGIKVCDVLELSAKP